MITMPRKPKLKKQALLWDSYVQVIKTCSLVNERSFSSNRKSNIPRKRKRESHFVKAYLDALIFASLIGEFNDGDDEEDDLGSEDDTDC